MEAEARLNDKRGEAAPEHDKVACLLMKAHG